MDAGNKIEQCLLVLGKLIGLLSDGGSINWIWFGDPESQILGANGIASRCKFLGQLIRCIKSGSPDGADEPFTDGYSWVPLNDPNASVQVGFVWTDTPQYDAPQPGKPQKLQFGFGSKANFQGANPQNTIDLAALVNLFQIGVSVEPLAGDVRFSGTFPAPAFLQSFSLSGQTKPPNITIGVTNKSNATRALTYPLAPPDSSILPWDCSRLAMFILESWIHSQAAAGTLFQRVDQHLFPMFGEPQTDILPFPLFGAMGAAANFKPWESSVSSISNNGAGPLEFLWHLRALLAGNTNQDFMKGSPPFMPLAVNGPYDPSAKPPADINAANAGVYLPATTSPAGAYIGIISTADGFALVLDLVKPGVPGNYLRLPLTLLTGSALPPGPDFTNAANFLPIPQASGISGTYSQAKSQLTISFSADLKAIDPLLGGTYLLNVMFDPAVSKVLPASFEIVPPKPAFSFLLPAATPPKPEPFLASLVDWVKSAIPAPPPGDPTADIAAIAKDLADFITAELKVAGSGKHSPLLLSIFHALSNGGKPLSLSIKDPPIDFTLDMSAAAITPGISIGPLKTDAIPNFPIGVGKLSASVSLAADNPGHPLSGFSLGIDDLRLGDVAQGADNALIASLIPDLRQVPGFTLQFVWTSAKGPQISGGGKIPIHLTLGPLSLSQLLVVANNNSLTIAINLTFQLSVITVTAYELGLTFQDYKSQSPTLALQGLGLNFEGAGITLSGLFFNNNNDYIGAASVSVEELFALTAIGGYKLLPADPQHGTQETPSLFIFASLVAPLGGPPFCFITGICGGFGFNRTLPPMTLMLKHPFVQIMNGEIGIHTDPKQGMSDLTQLDDPATGFAPKLGDYWIAAGIQFVSFGFINGKILAAVAFGHDFSFNLLGIASFGLKPVAFFEIDILVTVDAEKLLLVAGVSTNSYLIHPDVFSLSGDFALGVWHSGEHQGDFLISIGGFDPYFAVPAHYPALNRVSVKANVFGFVQLAVECFFACTPQALMAGASVSLSASFAGISAGLDVYIDVFIQWDPFFIRASMGVTVWFICLGRHEIGVELEIHTPKFGGLATIHLFIVSFDISFGDDLVKTPLTFDKFISGHLGVPATPGTAKIAANGGELALYNTEKAAGLIRVLFSSGRTITEKGDSSKAQEGTLPGKPVKVAPEFSFAVRTHLPFHQTPEQLKTAILQPAQPENKPKPLSQSAVLVGTVNLPLCGMGPLDSVLTVTLTDKKVSITQGIPEAEVSRSADWFPYANFAPDQLPSAQAGDDSARQAVSGLDTSHPAIPLVDTISFNLAPVARPLVDLGLLNGPEVQRSLPEETYPLPFGWPPTVKPTFVSAKPAVHFASNASLDARAKQLKPKPRADRRRSALQAMNAAGSAPWKVALMTGHFNRSAKRTASASTNVASPPPVAFAIAVPTSPQRRKELAVVALRMLAPHTTAASARRPVRSIAGLRAMRAVHTILTPAAVPREADFRARDSQPAAPVTHVVNVISGQAAHLNVSGNVIAPQGSLTFAGTQTVRAVYLTAFGEPLADQYVTGNQKVALPARASRVLLIGEGTPAPLGSAGVEPGSALFAISRREFAGHGCVVRAHTAILKHFEAGDTLKGSDVLPAAGSFSVLFPVPPRASTLLITVTPAVAAPEPAPSQVRWRASGATLANLRAIATPDGAAFLMDTQGTVAWTLDVEIDPDWRLTGIVMCSMASAGVLAALQANGGANFVDDHFVEPPAPASTTVTLEVANG